MIRDSVFQRRNIPTHDKLSKRILLTTTRHPVCHNSSTVTSSSIQFNDSLNYIISLILAKSWSDRIISRHYSLSVCRPFVVNSKKHNAACRVAYGDIVVRSDPAIAGRAREEAYASLRAAMAMADGGRRVGDRIIKEEVDHAGEEEIWREWVDIEIPGRAFVLVLVELSH